MAKLYPPIIEGSLPAFYESKVIEDSLKAVYQRQRDNLVRFVTVKLEEIERDYNAGKFQEAEYNQKKKELKPYEDEIISLRRRLSSGGIFLNVNFSMNAAVSQDEIAAIVLKFKRLQESTEIFTIESPVQASVEDENNTNPLVGINWNTFTVTFDLKAHASDIQIGEFYKIQIAFKSKGPNAQIGYYSNAGVIKYTSCPELSITNLVTDQTNLNPSMLIGEYTQTGDPSEKVYSYFFKILNSDFSLYLTTGEKLHNSELDSSATQSSDIFSSNFSFEDNKQYYVQYGVTTINGIKLTTQLYSIVVKYDALPSNILKQYKMVPTLNYDQGIINISLQSLTGKVYAVEGTFQILRASSKDNFKTWYILNKFLMPNLMINKFNYEDNTIEHGITYQYAIQQFNDTNNAICSNRIYSDKIVAKFEDIFLIGDALEEEPFASDELLTLDKIGTLETKEIMSAEGRNRRQLRIRFNPAISNYKRNLLEAKVDTLGNAYPFIFRNGQIKYRSFGISGIISYISDDEERFINHKMIEQKGANSVDLTDENIATERLFRNEVLKWLNNGRLKLFKSPTEGNMIIRLMNVSLTPEKATGRMIYSFSATAYEMDEYSIDNLIKYQFLNTRILIHKYRKSETIQLKGNYEQQQNLLNHYPAKAITVHLTENIPIVLLGLDGTNAESPSNTILTGKTKEFSVTNVNIPQVYFTLRQTFTQEDNCYITYEYESGASNTFNSISQMYYKDYPMIEMHNWEGEQYSNRNSNLLAVFNNDKVLIDSIGPIRFVKLRMCQTVYTHAPDLAAVINGTHTVSYNKDPFEEVSLSDAHFYYHVWQISTTPGQADTDLGYLTYNKTSDRLQSFDPQANHRYFIGDPAANDQSAFMDNDNQNEIQLDTKILNGLQEKIPRLVLTVGDNLTALFGIKLIVNTYNCEIAEENTPAYNQSVHDDKTALMLAVEAYETSRNNGSAVDDIKAKYKAIYTHYQQLINSLEEVLK